MSNDREEPVASTLEQVNEAVRVVPSPGSSLDVEMQQKDTTTNTPAGLGLRGLQPLPARVSK